jgi:hypothetical protein
MTSSDNADQDDDLFKDDDDHLFPINRRKSTRFVRNDIGAWVRKINLFNYVNLKANRDFKVKLVDISSRGVLISSDIKIATNKKIILTLRFSDFTEFEIPSRVVRSSEFPRLSFGIKFDIPNNELADYLLVTQRKLTFK